MSQDGTITFHFEDTPFRLRHRGDVRDWLRQVAHAFESQIGEIHYMFCSDEHMLAMNGRHLDHHYYTDILTFPSPSAHGPSGDILISIDRVRENARSLGLRSHDELHRVMAHGLLHLIGFDDTTPDLKQRMRQAEDLSLALRSFS